MTPNPSSDPPILAPAASPAAPASAPPELPVAPKLPSFLEAAGEPVETPSDPFPVLRTALASFRAELSEACPEIGRMLSEPLDRVTKPEVTLTFSGPFNAGKSTLLNAALRRPLLPMDELPETGTICRLRPGHPSVCSSRGGQFHYALRRRRRDGWARRLERRSSRA